MYQHYKTDPDAAYDEKRQEAIDKGFKNIAEMLDFESPPADSFFDQAAFITGMTNNTGGKNEKV